MLRREHEELFHTMKQIHSKVSYVLRLTGLLVFCFIGGWIIVADRDTVAYLIFTLFVLWIFYYHVDRIGYTLVKYVFCNNHDIRYVFGKSYDDFKNDGSEFAEQ